MIYLEEITLRKIVEFLNARSDIDIVEPCSKHDFKVDIVKSILGSDGVDFVQKCLKMLKCIRR